MENFNTDQKLHPSRFLRASDPFYPCQEQAERHQGDCYFYAPTFYLSLHKNDYIGALRWCESAPSPYRATCTQGVGSQAIKENINTPKLVEEICLSNKAMQADLCIAGMVGLFINHYGSLEPARKLCQELAPENRPACDTDGPVPLWTFLSHKIRPPAYVLQTRPTGIVCPQRGLRVGVCLVLREHQEF